MYVWSIGTGAAEQVQLVWFWLDYFLASWSYNMRVYIHTCGVCMHDHLVCGSCSHLSWRLAAAAAEMTRRSPRFLMLTIHNHHKAVWNSCLRYVMYQINPFSQLTCPFHVKSETVTETTKQWQWSTKVLREPIQITENWRWKFFPSCACFLSTLHTSMHCLRQWSYHSKRPCAAPVVLGLEITCTSQRQHLHLVMDLYR